MSFAFWGSSFVGFGGSPYCSNESKMVSFDF